MLEVIEDYKKKIQEDVTEQQFQTFLDSIELTEVEKGMQAYREFKASCEAAGMGAHVDDEDRKQQEDFDKLNEIN